MDKNKKIGIGALIILAAYAIYYFIFRPKTPYQIATDLGLYNDDPEHDACLNDMMATISATTGTNLDWELNQAKIRLSSPPAETYWKVGGIFYPVGALLVTVDSTFDWYAGSPDIAGQIPATVVQQYSDMLSGVITMPFTGDTYTDAAAADVLGYPVADLNAALANIPSGTNPYNTAMISALWGRFNAFKYLKEHPLPTINTVQTNGITPIFQTKK